MVASNQITPRNFNEFLLLDNPFLEEDIAQNAGHSGLPCTGISKKERVQGRVFNDATLFSPFLVELSHGYELFNLLFHLGNANQTVEGSRPIFFLVGSCLILTLVKNSINIAIEDGLNIVRTLGHHPIRHGLGQLLIQVTNPATIALI